MEKENFLEIIVTYHDDREQDLPERRVESKPVS